ncbi:MAG TPA: hypothetical protein VHM02_06135 [Thermoanaerobaculia bacterium]|nr:hypothetical protein [Thermoanaerobaculia bacterium]
MAAPTRERPWWLGGDPAEVAETCERCLATYAVEVEVRCVDCDGPMCPSCAVVVRETAEVRCHGCHGAVAGGGG